MKINIVGFLEKVYSHLPKLSPELKGYVAGVLPSISLVFGLLITLASVLELLGTPFISLVSVNSSNIPAIQILLLVNAIGVFQGLFMVFAFGPLKARHEKGWRFLVWSQILWIVSSALSFSTAFILALVLFYPIMQAKSEYRR